MLAGLCLLAIASTTDAHAAMASARRDKAGEIHRITREPSAAARNNGDDRLRMTIWYPAAANADERPVVIGPHDSPVFVAGRVATDAAWAEAPGYPLVLLSHGLGDSARQMTWLGAALARSGYVVVAVDHPGTNGVDGVTPQGAYARWERAGDLTAALDAVLADPAIAPHIDAARIGVAGFALGGWTAALIAGARADFAHLDRFCASPQRDSACKPQRVFAPDVAKRANVLKTAAMRPLAAHARASFRDTRVDAAFLIAPALGQAIDPASLAAITIPVFVLAGSADPVAVPRTNAEVFADDIPGARLTMLPDVRHYDFLSECGSAGAGAARVRCKNGVGTFRSKTHATTIAAVTRFFDAALNPASEAATPPVVSRSAAAALE